MSCIFENTAFIRIALRQTDSTNSALREALADQTMGALPEYFTIVAAYQLAGRGQQGNSWESEAGKNLLFSTLLHPEFLNPKNQFLLSQIVSLALVNLLEQYAPEEPFSIKWPNDIYWKERKICGILIEHTIQGESLSDSIVGVGLNVNQKEFPDYLPNPCSLIQIIGIENDLNECLIRLMSSLRRLYESLREGDPLVIAKLEKQYHRALYRGDGKLYPFRDAGGAFKARILRVEEGGRLWLVRENGTEQGYLFKEVEFLGIEGEPDANSSQLL